MCKRRVQSKKTDGRVNACVAFDREEIAIVGEDEVLLDVSFAHARRKKRTREK